MIVTELSILATCFEPKKKTAAAGVQGLRHGPCRR